MEAVLERPKGKKRSVKSEHALKTTHASNIGKNLSFQTDKEENILLEEKPIIKDSKFDVPQTNSHISEEDLTTHSSEKDIEIKRDDLDTSPSGLNIVTSKKKCGISEVISENIANVTLSHVDSNDEAIISPSKEDSVVCSALASEVHPLSNHGLMKYKESQSLHMYPDLKCIQICEQMHSITCSQTLVKTYINEYQWKTVNQANEGFQDFIKVANESNKHPLCDMTYEYHRAKKSCIHLHSRIKYLNSDLKRKKDSLWKSVKKEASAKGCCDDGYNVTVSHSFIIKELNNNKFDEVIRTLKEIEESLSLDAFHSYVEELTKLRIEYYLSHLVKDEYEVLKDNEEKILSSDELSFLKRSISILFDCLRQNAPDKNYAETCRKWLRALVSKLLESGKFTDHIFIINHVIRCPSGIENWASEFIQMTFDVCAREKSKKFDCICCQRILLVLYLVLNPIPERDFFLKNLKDCAALDSLDGNFTVLDSDGEEEELFEMLKNWTDNDILSLLNQIPVRRLYRHLMLDTLDSNDTLSTVPSEEKMLKMLAYSSVLIDVLYTGMETYCFQKFPKLFYCISNLIGHILSYISNYWACHVKLNSSLKVSIQAVYDRLFFHIIFQAYNRLDAWKVLSIFSYEYISKKMLWNIMWIFFSPRISEEDIYSEKDVDKKIQDESVQRLFINNVKQFSPENTFHFLATLKEIALSSNGEADFLKFLTELLFQIIFIEASLTDNLLKEGCAVLSSILHSYPYLISVMLKEIDTSNDGANLSFHLFEKLSLVDWIPEDSDVCIISSWLLSNPLSQVKSQLARLILGNMNWEFNKEGTLFLPQKLHKRIAILVTDAYLKFDYSGNEWRVSRGVKQILQFATIGTYQRNEEGFVHWAWNVLFSLKLHPLDKRCPPWISIYDGSIDDANKVVDDIILKPLTTVNENQHPSGCYLTIVMTDVGLTVQNLMNTGLNCLSFLVERQQYMAAIKSLYYILPFFVKNSEQLLNETVFIRTMSDLIAADMTVISNITGEPVIGAVLHNIAAMMKHQIYQAWESTVECAAPLLKLWIKILMKILHQDKASKNKIMYSTKQIYFLLDVLVKISYLDSYIRDSTLDLLSTFNNSSGLTNSNQTFWRRMFISSSSYYGILNENVPEYPWLSWFILSSEMKQKTVQNVWTSVQSEMLKENDASVSDCLKKASDHLKIDMPPLEYLPIYRWGILATEIPVSHPVSPLLWQQFFICFFQRVNVPNSQNYVSVGMKYFKFGRYVEIMNKMKKHLGDTEQYYRNYLKSSAFSEGHMPSAPRFAGDKSMAESPFHLNMLKLFCAFQLWLNDESLQNAELCLSTLDPKYCPDHLKLVLNGDQNVWFDMVSNTYLKDELDQKIHCWNVKKNPAISSKLSSTRSDSLHDLIFKHIENFETQQLTINELPTYTHLKEINNFPLSSTDELVQLIEKNQSIILDKAQFFSKQMKKIKQLNFNFINWVPQEYKNEDCEIIETKACHKGMGANGCSGPAPFRLKIQNYIKNERICEKIYNNRADYVIIQDQLTKLPVKDLCYATLLIENDIRSLSNKMKASKNEVYDHFRNIGVALFYHQIDTIDKVMSVVAEYSPSRVFFSSIIECLGSEFIDGNDSELQNLVKSILNHPEAGSLALPLFNPNKSCAPHFQHVYEALALAIGKYSPSTLLALYSKFDFSLWLKENSPHFGSRKEMFNHISNALLSCDRSPSPEIYPVFEILKKHFKIVLLYMFPELFLEAVFFLLNGIENKNLCVDVFYEAFLCFGCPLFNEKSSVENIEFGLKKFAFNQQLPANQQIFITGTRLNLKQVKDVSKIFHQYFMKKRNNCELYKNHSDYIKPLGIFLGIISHSLIALQVDENVTKNQSLDISDLWEDFHSPFWPWLHPFVNELGITFPWSDEEVNLASYMFQVFTASVKYFHEQLLSHDFSENVLSSSWNLYMQIYVIPGYRHYSVSLCHSALIDLPWHQFHPSANDIEGMCQVLQSNLEENKQFLSKLSLKIPWCDVIKKISATNSINYVGKVLTTFGKLLIISHLNCVESEKNVHPTIFKDLECLNWHFLSLEDTESLLNLYYSNSDPFLKVNKLKNNSDSNILQFLKLVCCMVPNANGEDYSNSKRVLYLQKYIYTFSAFLSNMDQKIKAGDELKAVLPHLLTEINNIICNAVSPDVQINHALPLVKETIIILNTLLGNELDLVILNSIIFWIKTNVQSPLLLPCLKVSSYNLHSISHVVSLSECCISTRFSYVLDPTDKKSIWHLISSLFHVPTKSCESFLKECIKENAYLSLYCYILHVIPQSNSMDLKRKLLQRMIQWIRESKLSNHAEAKFLLLWDKILEISICLVLQGDNQVVKQELISFCWEIGILAEDRSNAGFFATFGLGQVSNLSVNFRFLCRVMSAFILYQIPDNTVIRIEPTSPNHLPVSDNSSNRGRDMNNLFSPSPSALKAMENLKGLLKKKSFTALQPHIDYAVKCVLDSEYNLSESRKLLKYFALVLFPKESYLSTLDS